MKLHRAALLAFAVMLPLACSGTAVVADPYDSGFPVDEGDRWMATKLLVDFESASTEQQAGAVESPVDPSQILVVATYTGCGVEAAFAIPTPDDIIVEFFYNAVVSCTQSFDTEAQFLVDRAGNNSRGSWNYESVPPVRVVTTGLQTPPSARPSVERVSIERLDEGVPPEIVFDERDDALTDAALAALGDGTPGDVTFVTADFEGCVLVEARAIPMPTEVLVRAAFDSDVACEQAVMYRAIFIIESQGENAYGDWAYRQQPSVNVEIIGQ